MVTPGDRTLRLSSHEVRPTVRAKARRPVRPILLMLVLGAFLVVIGLTASGQALLVTSDTSTTLLNATVGADVATARSFVTLNLRRSDLVEAGITPERRVTLDQALRLLTDKGQILHEAILAPDGSILAADDPASTSSGPPPDGFRAAVASKAVQAAIVPTEASAAFAPIGVPTVIREYLPRSEEHTSELQSLAYL